MATAEAPRAEGGAPHVLSNPWTFYYYHEQSAPQNSGAAVDTLNEYRRHLRVVFNFSTVEEFWAHYQYIKRPTELPLYGSYKVFQKDVPPEWEYPKHKGGGQINFYAPKEFSPHIFELMVLALIGGCFGKLSSRISGINLTNKGNTSQFALWLQKGEESDTNSIKETLEEILGYDQKFKQTTNITYKKFGNE